MAVEKIVGPSGVPEPSKKKRGVDADAFKEMMKVGKAREVDPEEQRKRKSQQELEEEIQANLTTAPPPPAPEETKTAPPQEKFQLKIGETSASSAAPTSGGEYEAPEEPSSWEPYSQVPTPSPEQPASRKKTVSSQEKAPIEKKKAVAKQPAVNSVKKKPLAAPEREKPQAAKPPHYESQPPLASEKKQAFFDQLSKPIKEEEKEKQAEEILEAPPPPLPSGGWETIIAQEKEKKEPLELPSKEEAAASFYLPTPTAAPLISIEPSSPALYTTLHPQVMELFDRMVGVMIVMTDSAVKQTTIHLDAPQFASSIFYGSEIVISEFSTAPKTFNIELRGSPEAVALFQGNAQELVAAFQAGGYNFNVNRIDTSIIAVARSTQRKTKVTKVKKSQEEKGT